MKIQSWSKLAEFAEDWGDQALSKLIGAERKAALNPADASSPAALYHSPNYIPGTLQTRAYIDALCRGVNGMSQHWIQRNIQLRLARQQLLRRTGLTQRFLVHEAALIYRPNLFKEVILPQLEHVLTTLHDDLKGYKRLDFRVIPSSHWVTLPEDVYKDTFNLYKVGDETEGFKEPWLTCLIEPTAGPETTRLEYSWEQIGSVALNPTDSLDCVHYALRNAAAY